MKRRDFLKLGAVAVIGGTAMANETAGQMTAAMDDEADWSVKFNSVTAHITQDTYDTFFNDRQRNQSPECFLGYLLSGAVVPRCEKVDSMQYNSRYNIVQVTFTGVLFSGNARQYPANFFSGYEYARFCLSSPNSQSGMYITFSEREVNYA